MNRLINTYASKLKLKHGTFADAVMQTLFTAEVTVRTAETACSQYKLLVAA